MPELPDVTVYVEALRDRVIGHTLTRAIVRGPFLLRSTHPPLSAFEGAKATDVRRVGKRVAIGFDNGAWLALHLMIAGRLHWKTGPVKPTDRRMLAAFEFDNGALTLTEAGWPHRATLTAVESEAALRALDAGGIEPLDITLDEFAGALQSANHTLKRALTDPRLFSGIGNAYSDEILHQARLSPVALTQKLTREQVERLYHAVRDSLTEWTERLRADARGKFPEKVTAFRDGMAVHGRHGLACPVCGATVQRIRYASNETNYCPHCQTGGKLLADRALSRLLREDWPKTPDELEMLKRR